MKIFYYLYEGLPVFTSEKTLKSCGVAIATDVDLDTHRLLQIFKKIEDIEIKARTYGANPIAMNAIVKTAINLDRVIDAEINRHRRQNQGLR